MITETESMMENYSKYQHFDVEGAITDNLFAVICSDLGVVALFHMHSTSVRVQFFSAQIRRAATWWHLAFPIAQEHLLSFTSCPSTCTWVKTTLLTLTQTLTQITATLLEKTT